MDKKTISQNFVMGFEIAKKEYEFALSRFKEMDNKFNMLLVFAAGELTAFGATFSTITDNIKFRLFYIIIFLPTLFIAILQIFRGLFTKRIQLFDTFFMKCYKDFDVDGNNFIGRSIASYNECIKSIEKVIKLKSKLFNTSLVFILFAFIIFCTFMIINLFI